MVTQRSRCIYATLLRNELFLRSQRFDARDALFLSCAGKIVVSPNAKRSLSIFVLIQAVNSAGPGPYSMLGSCVTPAAAPAVGTSLKVHPKSTSMTLTWKEPANNGSPITGYHIDLGEKELIFVNPDLTEYVIDEVLPDTNYK